jgi:hypothetical protein
MTKTRILVEVSFVGVEYCLWVAEFNVILPSIGRFLGLKCKFYIFNQERNLASHDE